MTAIPKLILPPEGMPWGRWTQSQIAKNANTIAQVRTSLNATNATQSAAIRKMAAQIAVLQEQQAQLAAQEAALEDVVSHLGNLVRSTLAATTAFTWTGDSTWNSVSSPITVPTGAQKVDLSFSVEAVFCANASAGTAIETYVGCAVPELGIGGTTGPADIGVNVVVQSNEQGERVRAYTASQQDVTSVSTLTFYGFGAATNTGENDNNSLKVTAQAIFSF